MPILGPEPVVSEAGACSLARADPFGFSLYIISSPRQGLPDGGGPIACEGGANPCGGGGRCLERTNGSIYLCVYIYIHTYTYIYIYIYICICVCVCVCVCMYIYIYIYMYTHACMTFISLISSCQLSSCLVVRMFLLLLSLLLSYLSLPRIGCGQMNGLNTNGAAAEVINFDRLGENIRPALLGI